MNSVKIFFNKNGIDPARGEVLFRAGKKVPETVYYNKAIRRESYPDWKDWKDWEAFLKAANKYEPKNAWIEINSKMLVWLYDLEKKCDTAR